MAPHRNHVEARSSRAPARQYAAESHDHKADAPVSPAKAKEVLAMSRDEILLGRNVIRTKFNRHEDAVTALVDASLDAVLTLLPEGFWWRGGTCSVSSEATVCPDHNGPHRERLLRECPPTELIWDEGIETELRPGSNNALIRALLSAILKAKQSEPRHER